MTDTTQSPAETLAEVRAPGHDEVPTLDEAIRWLAAFEKQDEVASTTPRKIAFELAGIHSLLVGIRAGGDVGLVGRIAAAIKELMDQPLQGPAHGVWDRGRVVGLRTALAIVRDAALTRRAGGGAGRPLGRFGHHPDPAIDFEIEVAEIESIAENARLGLAGSKHEADRAGLSRRIELALLFQVGGDPSACAAKAKLRAIAGRDAIGQSDGDPDGWLAVKVNAEGGIVMPYGPLHAGPDRPNDARYRWAPFYLGEPQ